MPVYEHSNIDFGKTQTHFSAIQAILRSKIIRISKIGAPAFFLPDKYGKMRFTTRRERRSMEENSRMKRKAAVMLLLMTLGAASVSGCGKNNTTSSSSVSSASSTSASSASDASSAGSTSSDSTASEEYASPSDVDGIPVVDEEVDSAECVTLGDYKKLTLEKKVEQVTDDDVQTAIMAETAVTMDDPDATVQKGDTADIAYVGKVDGKEFDGGSSDSYNLVIGSGTFIDGFEDGVVGMKTGETKDLNLKFPDSYQSTDLAGKDVVFTVTVNAFTRPAENIDGWELDDAWVAKNTDYSTVEEYRAGKRAELEAANETTAENNLQNDAMQQMADGCTFHKIPKSYITLGEEDYDKRYTTYLQNYGISLDDYLEQYADRATYNQEKATYAGTMAKSALLLDAVEQGEGLTEKQKTFHKRTRLRDLALLTLLLGTGIRVSECVGLDINDVDFKNGGIHIHRKGGKEVTVYFGSEVENALQDYLDERFGIIPEEGSEQALFLSMQRKRMNVRSVENLVKKYAHIVTPLKKITPHKLRSTYGTNLYRETGDIYLVADVLGHSDVNTTKKHYAALEDERRRSARNVVKLREP